MTRRLLNLVTALSLLLCVAVVMLWVRSHWVADYVYYTRLTPHGTVVRADEFVVQASEGSVAALVTLHGYEVDSPEMPGALAMAGFRWEAGDPGLPEFDRTFIGFGYDALAVDDTTTGTFRSWGVLVPLWFPTLLLGTLPAARLYRRIRRPHPAGLCPRCGYDLRATPGRCPECGEEPQRAR